MSLIWKCLWQRLWLLLQFHFSCEVKVWKEWGSNIRSGAEWTRFGKQTLIRHRITICVFLETSLIPLWRSCQLHLTCCSLNTVNVQNQAIRSGISAISQLIFSIRLMRGYIYKTELADRQSSVNLLRFNLQQCHADRQIDRNYCKQFLPYRTESTSWVILTTHLIGLNSISLAIYVYLYIQ
jgi:hypothetical protein